MALYVATKVRKLLIKVRYGWPLLQLVSIYNCGARFAAQFVFQKRWFCDNMLKQISQHNSSMSNPNI